MSVVSIHIGGRWPSGEGPHRIRCARGRAGHRLIGDATHVGDAGPLGRDGIGDFIVPTGFDYIDDDWSGTSDLGEERNQRNEEGHYY